MARATFVKRARKDVPGTDVKAGDSYWWWKFRRGGKHYSKEKPRPSQLTQSEFYSQVYAIQERIEDASADDGLRDLRDEVAQELRDIGEECGSRRDNMPESLQDSETGSLLQERVDAMEAAADEFENLELDDPEESDLLEGLEAKRDGESDEEFAARRQAHLDNATTAYWQGKLEEMQAVSIDSP